ncbi:12-oxophytodienoate reductase [Asticcacaulis sp. AC460]|uniref:NADH:flavin oxidoreductase n=1 Tax=Asticcacaulis sp. AC460 TaxID=1282360 RepID=UPI0003C3E37D|nr:NADH:flavin oxidoreductase [Asticcacaulis sp. AC460]ESQ93312.1 12-oxophytodienoate reductase [Asticcacaulis sp. AC460]
MSHTSLFSPFASKSLELDNRIVMAPMTRNFSPGGVPDQAVVDYYRRRAESGVGLIVTEGTVIERPASKNEANIPNIYGEGLAGWAKVVEAVHAAGGKIAPQIWHTGAAFGRNPQWRPTPMDTPSGISLSDEAVGEPMTEADIADTIAAFGRAAGDAKRLGFDAIELHGAHGYLIDEFFWAHTNRRTDVWGGATIGERTRFAVEVLKAARAAVGPDFPIIIRLSQWKGGHWDNKLAADPAEMEAWLQPLVDAGANILHASQRRFWEPEFEGSDLNFAGWAKKVTGVPTITVGSVGLNGEFIAAFGGAASEPQSLDELLRRLDRGDFDLVAVGRAILNDPEWVAKVRDSRHDDLKAFSPAAFATLY